MDFEKELEKILGNEELSAEEKQKEINKLTGTCFISKSNHQKSIDKLNDEIAGYKTSITEKDEELDKIKTAQLSDEEKVKKALADAQKARKEALIDRNKSQAEKILTKSGMSDEDIEEIIDGIVSEDLEETKNMANKIATVMSKQIETTEKRVKDELISETKKPNSGNAGEKKITQEDFDKMTFDQMIEFKEKNPELYKQFI